MKVLDSDFLISILNGNKEAKEKIAELLSGKEEITTTVLNMQEILFIPLNEKRIKEFNIAIELINNFKVLSYDFDSVFYTLNVEQALRKNGGFIGDFDQIIAGICLRHNATIVTRNIKHFSRIEGLNISD